MDIFSFRVVVDRKNGTVIVKDGPDHGFLLLSGSWHVNWDIDWHIHRSLFFWLGAFLDIDGRALVRLEVLSSETDIDSAALFFDHLALPHRLGLLEDLFGQCAICCLSHLLLFLRGGLRSWQPVFGSRLPQFQVGFVANFVQLGVLQWHESSAVVNVMAACPLHLRNHLIVLLKKLPLEGSSSSQLSLMAGLLIDIFELRITIRRLRNLGARFNLDIHLALLGRRNRRQ